MSIYKQKWIKRIDLIKNPNTLYVFGDNMSKRGYGGQAKEMRGEPNSVGIPTKWTPRMTPEAFFKDEDFPLVMSEINSGFRRILQHLSSGHDVIIPETGIGTSLSKLEEKAPRIFYYIQKCLQRIIDSYGEEKVV